MFPYRILYTHWIPPVSTHQSTLCGTESRAASSECCTQHVVVANSNESSRLRSQGFWRGCWCGLTGRVRVTSVRKDSFLPVWPTEVTFTDCQVKTVGEEQEVSPYGILYTHWIPPVSTNQSTLCGTESRAASSECCTQHVVVANSNESSRLRSQGFWRGCWCGLTGRVRVTSVRKDSSFLPVWPTEVTFSDCQVKIVGEEEAQQSKGSHIESYTHIGFLQCQLTNRLYVELKAGLQAVNAARNMLW